jgi:hypothetical protein
MVTNVVNTHNFIALQVSVKLFNPSIVVYMKGLLACIHADIS